MIITLPNFNPNIIEFGPFAIRWYSLAYILGIVFTFFILKKFNAKSKIMGDKAMEDWFIWAVLGVILGGRLGYVLFYNFGFYSTHPLEILAVWHGGMSFHGGLIGSITSMFLFAKKYKIDFFKLTDVIAIATPIGLFFGRLANFINMELYGRVTNSNFGVIFPNAGEAPRHPSQLYEAVLEGLLPFIILFLLANFTKSLQKRGLISGLFLIFYASARIFVEQFREPDVNLGFIFDHVTMGQMLSVPIMLFGLILIFRAKITIDAETDQN